MRERTLHVSHVGAAALVIGGGIAVALPQHAPSMIRLVLGTLATSAGLYALASNVPESGWIFPFKWMSPFNPSPTRGETRAETDAIRSALSDWRHPIGHGPPMPVAVLRLLKPLIASAIDLDPASDTEMARAREELSPLSFAILTSDPSGRPRWMPKVPPDGSEVAEAVSDVLNEIERLSSRGVDDPRHHDTSYLRLT